MKLTPAAATLSKRTHKTSARSKNLARTKASSLLRKLLNQLFKKKKISS